MGKKINSLNKKIPLSRKGISVLTGLSVSLLAFSSVEALNIGQARTQSYLGQPLSIFLPVNDLNRVIDLNQLIVGQPSSAQLQELSVTQTINDLSYQVVSKGSEKGILITTQSAFNEPYVDLGVKIDYQGDSQLSKLTVLIDLEPLATNGSSSLDFPKQIAAAATYGNPLIESTSPNKIPIEPNIEQRSSVGSELVTYSGEIMGPYDWAQKSLIPEKFGPVIPGQSLWRVARRINQSMGVSIDQMMWGLYRANPQAFSGKSVSTLQAGSILSIPRESFVREVTELEAVRLLNSEVAEKSTILPVQLEQVPTTETPVVQQVIDDVKQVEVNPSSVVDSQLEPEASNAQAVLEAERTASSGIIQKSQADSIISLSRLDIVDDLKSEIQYLNQQVEEQDKRIQSLEQRLAIAESNGSVEVAESLASAENVISPILSSEQVVTPSENSVESSNNVTTPAAVTKTTDNLGLNADWSLTKVWSVAKEWSLGALILLFLGLAYFARNKVVPMILKMFGGSYEYDEEESFLDSVSKKRTLLTPQSTTPVATETSSGDSNSEKVKSKKSNEDHEDFEDYSFFIDNSEIMDVEELSFPDRIQQLIDLGDFEEAKKTVNFASKANVNEYDINVYLLKIFAAESDRENFDKLFDEIHLNIDEYDDEAQLMVAEIQAEMAIGKVINFNDEKKAG